MSDTFEYQFNTGPEPPTGSQVRLNNASPALATKLWMTYTTSPGQDIRHMLGFNVAGDKMLVQDWDDSTKYVVYTLTTDTIDKGGYAEYGVVATQSGAALAAQKIAVVFAPEALPAASRDPGDVLTIAPSGEPEWLAPVGSPGGGGEPVPVGGSCTWPVSYAQCASCPPLGTVEEPTLDRAMFEEMAVTYLWNWTGRVYGACPVVVRPCRQDCPGGSTFWGLGPYPLYGSSAGGAGVPWTPALIGGKWYNLGCGWCGDICGCNGTTPALRLPGPVTAVSRVLIDGTVLDPSAYRVDNLELLVRTDGKSWPVCQDMNSPVTATSTFEISYSKGLPVPMGGQVAAGVLACELAKAACGDSSCALPQRVQTITRQGVTIAMLDAFDDVDQGHTGIWLIDSWISSVTKSPRPSQVYSVDKPRPAFRRTTWPST